MAFTPIGKLVQNAVGRTGLGDQVQASLVLEQAQKVLAQFFGNDADARMKPLYVKRKVLTVSCISSVAAQELKLREKDIIKAINKESGETAVERLRFFA